MWKEYKEFLMRGNLLDLAVAFVLGAAFNAVVQALANDVIMGTIAGLLNLDQLREMSIGPVRVGTFIAALLAFVVVATVLFFVVRAAARLDRSPPEETLAPERDEVLLLREIRDALVTRG